MPRYDTCTKEVSPQGEANRPLYGPCDGCRSRGVLWYVSESDRLSGYYCPRCRRELALASAAGEDLRVRLREMLKAHFTIWGQDAHIVAQTQDDLEEAAREIIPDLIAEMSLPPYRR